jgi:hypothetical protein
MLSRESFIAAFNAFAYDPELLKETSLNFNDDRKIQIISELISKDPSFIDRLSINEPEIDTNQMQVETFDDEEDEDYYDQESTGEQGLDEEGPWSWEDNEMEENIQLNRVMTDFTLAQIEYINNMDKKERILFVKSLDISDRVRNNLKQRLNYRRNPEKYRGYVKKCLKKKKARKENAIATIQQQLTNL